MTKNSGIYITASTVAVSIPPITAVPMAMRLFAPAPLATASGPGANSLRAIGTGVIGGMLVSTLVATFFVPLFFYLLETWSARFSRKKMDAADASAGERH